MAFCILPFALPCSANVPDGYVVRVESTTLYLDWGASAGLHLSDQFTVYRPGAPLKHPVTGEILGHTQLLLGKGSIDRIEDKFSVGHLLERDGRVQSGDRSHLQQPSPAEETSLPKAHASSPEPVAAGASATPSRAPRQLWQSDPIKVEAVSLAWGNLMGDGQKQLIVASRDLIQVFRLKDNHLELVTTYKDPHYRHWVSVEAADIRRAGRDEIFASAMFDAVQRPHSVVLRWDQGVLKSAADIGGFVRQIDRMGGTKTLVLEDMSRNRDIRFTAPSELTFADEKYKVGPPLKLERLRDDQLFGFSLGDWDGDKTEDLALLPDGDHLRVFFHDSKWSGGSDLYGGTKNDFSVDNDKSGSLLPRLIAYHPSGEKDQLLVPHNVPELGIRLTHLKLYKKAQIHALGWNGLEMAPVWQIPITGYLADYVLADGLSKGTDQLWAAVIGPGDKTTLVAYSLP